MAAKKNLVKIYEFALGQEETGKNFFESSLVRMGIGAAKDAFELIIMEEEKHIQMISDILSDLRLKGEIDRGSLEMIIDAKNYFDDRAKKEFLEQCIEGSMVPDVTVFNTAWLIEKDLSEFYAMMAGKTEGRDMQAFRMLSDWEKRHEKFFKEYRDKLTEIYGKMPWGG
jgi:rubrerythrin